MTKEEFLKEFKNGCDYYDGTYKRCVNGKLVEIKNVSNYAEFPLIENGLFGLVAPYHDRYNFMTDEDENLYYGDEDMSLYEFSQLLLDNGYNAFKLYCYEHSGFNITGYEKVTKDLEPFDDDEGSFYGILYTKEDIENIDRYIEETNCWFDGDICSFEILDKEGFNPDVVEWYYGSSKLEKDIENIINWNSTLEEDTKAELEYFAKGILTDVSERSKIKLKEMLKED